MVRTQIQLKETQATALKERAARENVSMAELIRRSVDMLMSTNELPGEARWRRALSAAGSVSSGLNDLAANHDKYLAEAYAE